ncbi:MAG TPA: hypothetical protein VH934_15505 [Xanthobacteraceae bacterium]
MFENWATRCAPLPSVGRAGASLRPRLPQLLIPLNQPPIVFALFFATNIARQGCAPSRSSRAIAASEPGEGRDGRSDIRTPPASDHDLRRSWVSADALGAQAIGILERDVDAGAAGGVGGKPRDIEHTEIAVRDLRQADRILQAQALVTREPQMRRPLPPLRRRKAIEHDESQLWIACMQARDQPEPELELLRLDRPILTLAQPDRHNEPAGQRQFQKIIGMFAPKLQQLDAAACSAACDFAQHIRGNVREVGHARSGTSPKQILFRREHRGGACQKAAVPEHRKAANALEHERDREKIEQPFVALPLACHEQCHIDLRIVLLSQGRRKHVVLPDQQIPQHSLVNWPADSQRKISAFGGRQLTRLRVHRQSQHQDAADVADERLADCRAMQELAELGR